MEFAFRGQLRYVCFSCGECDSYESNMMSVKAARWGSSASFPQFLPPTEVRISRGRVWLFLLGEQWTFLNMRRCLDEEEDTNLASKRNHGNSFLRLHGARKVISSAFAVPTGLGYNSCWLFLLKGIELIPMGWFGRGAWTRERGRIFGPLLIYTPPGQCALVSWHWTYLAQIPTNIHGCMESSEILWHRNILGLIK